MAQKRSDGTGAAKAGSGRFLPEPVSEASMSRKFVLLTACAALTASLAAGAAERAPVQQAALPQKAPAQTYLLFFESGKDRLAPEGKEIVADAASQAKMMQDGQIRIMTTGEGVHPDQLARQRAEAVKQELVRDGLKPGAIVAGGTPSNLVYADADPTVKNWLNRRAVIVISKAEAS
jgi:outer membrane protein OmpA-like peptidoglycan-associated protein